MIPHPQTMQMVADQRWQELQGKVAHERLGMMTLLAAGTREIFHCPTPCRVTAAYGMAWPTALASVTFVLRALLRISQLGWRPTKEVIVVQHIVVDPNVLKRADAEAPAAAMP